MEGPLSKWTNLMNGWQYRWFVLDNSTGLLSYYTSKEKMVRGTRRGCVRLKGAIVGIDNEDDSTFTITDEARTFHFQAHDSEEREKWIRALEDAVIHHSATHKKWDLCDTTPSMADFDRRLTESDAYLQILIEQSSNLEQLIEKSNENAEKLRIQVILSNLNQIIESVKHCIVLLQIAKNTAFPVYGFYKPMSITDSQNIEHSQINGDRNRSSLWNSDLQETNVDISSVGMGQVSHVKSVGASMFSANIPEMSYCSSDDDDFVDVDEYDSFSHSLSGSRSFTDATEMLPNNVVSPTTGGISISSMMADADQVSETNSDSKLDNVWKC